MQRASEEPHSSRLVDLDQLFAQSIITGGQIVQLILVPLSENKRLINVQYNKIASLLRMNLSLFGRLISNGDQSNGVVCKGIGS